MRILLAAVACLFAFGSSAEARTHHYRHYAHHAHHERYHAHRVARRYRHRMMDQQQFADVRFGAQSTFGESAPVFNTGFAPGQQPAAGRRSTSREYSRFAGSEYRRPTGGRPAAWCGWYMRSQVGADPGPQYNLARSWAHYGSNAGGPSVGAIVVWPHHVGKIVGQENGQWIVQSGNDGHAVRTRARSLAGAIAFRNAYGAM
jgi:hypothetical protein